MIGHVYFVVLLVSVFLPILAVDYLSLVASSRFSEIYIQHQPTGDDVLTSYFVEFGFCMLLLQVLAIEDLLRKPMTNMVFMGMGEPLINLGAVLDDHLS